MYCGERERECVCVCVSLCVCVCVSLYVRTFIIVYVSCTYNCVCLMYMHAYTDIRIYMDTNVRTYRESARERKEDLRRVLRSMPSTFAPPHRPKHPAAAPPPGSLALPAQPQPAGNNPRIIIHVVMCELDRRGNRCMYLCMYMYICTRMYVCMYVYMYVCVCMYTYDTHICNVYTYIHTYIRTYVHTYIRTYVHTY